MDNLSALLFYLLLFGAVFYLLIYRPQQKQRKQREDLLDSLRVGLEVITIGGIHGEIMRMDGETVTVKIAENVEIKMQRNAIGIVKDAEIEGGEEDEEIEPDSGQ